MSLTEVAAQTGLTRAGARRILLTLEHLGYVVLEGRRFRLLPKILELGFAYLASLDITDTAQPMVEELVARVGESCTASILDGDEIVCVARVAVRRLMSINLSVGSRLPASACAMGRVLLAGLSDDELDRFLETARLPSFTERTIIEPLRLREAVLHARRDGYAIVDEELETGLRSLAVPLRDARRRTVAAVTVCVQASRYSVDDMLERIYPPLVEAAGKAEVALRAHM